VEFKQSLARRILIAFVLLTALVAGSFAVGIVNIVHLIEERLITTELGGDLNRLLRMDNMDEWRTRPQMDQIFYFDGGEGDFALPDDVRDLSPGFHEVFRDGRAFHAMVDRVDDRQYVLMQDQSGFEEREQVLFAVVLCGFAASLVLSAILGWLVARHVMAPVVRLAGQVRHRDQMLTLAPLLATDYAQDEVGQLAAAFDDTLGRLREVLTRERLFTSDVSHELRTPLMVMASSCELLLESAALDARGRAQIARMARACEEMRVLVQTFLLLARTEHDNMQLSPQVSLSALAEDLAVQWRDPIESKGLAFIYEGHPPQRESYNAAFLRSVMGNLLRNAWHYTEHGHIKLVVSANAFRVEDSGAGIPESQREAIFQPFVRASNERRGEGLGLGLSLVQRICENQNWRVSLVPSEAGGCCFQVDLESPESSQAALPGSVTTA
jgi:signal transduction histidine kinase